MRVVDRMLNVGRRNWASPQNGAFTAFFVQTQSQESLVLIRKARLHPDDVTGQGRAPEDVTQHPIVQSSPLLIYFT